MQPTHLVPVENCCGLPVFKKNRHHLQIPITSHVDELPEKLRKRLENSWAGVFYRDFFCRIDEAPFAVLYADCPSRPNTLVEVLVGLEFLKAGHGWADEEMYDNYCYDTQVRRPRRRRSRDQQEEGRNLRAAVEATVRSLKHPFPAGKLPVRGQFRVACLLIGSAAVANVRRIQRYLEGKKKAEKLQNAAPQAGKSAQERSGFSIFTIARRVWAVLYSLTKPHTLAVSW